MGPCAPTPNNKNLTSSCLGSSKSGIFHQWRPRESVCVCVAVEPHSVQDQHINTISSSTDSIREWLRRIFISLCFYICNSLIFSFHLCLFLPFHLLIHRRLPRPDPLPAYRSVTNPINKHIEDNSRNLIHVNLRILNLLSNIRQKNLYFLLRPRARYPVLGEYKHKPALHPRHPLMIVQSASFFQRKILRPWPDGQLVCLFVDFDEPSPLDRVAHRVHCF